MAKKASITKLASKAKRKAGGGVDKRTKEGKAIAERLAKARAARAKKSKFTWLFGKKKK